MEPEEEMMKNDQQDDEVEPQIITSDMISAQEEKIGPNIISDNEDDEPEPEAKWIPARPSQNTRLISELKITHLFQSRSDQGTGSAWR